MGEKWVTGQVLEVGEEGGTGWALEVEGGGKGGT